MNKEEERMIEVCSKSLIIIEKKIRDLKKEIDMKKDLGLMKSIEIENEIYSLEDRKKTIYTLIKKIDENVMSGRKRKFFDVVNDVLEVNKYLIPKYYY